MLCQYIYEFYESKLKLKQWEFEYFRDLEMKKVIHKTDKTITKGVDTMRISERNINVNII